MSPNCMVLPKFLKNYTSIETPDSKNQFLCYQGTTSTPPKLVVAPPTIAHDNGTQQWHHVHSSKVGRHPLPNHRTLQWHHTTMAPCNGTTSTPPKLAVTPPTIAPGNATTSTPSKLVITLPHNHRTLQWHHTTLAPSNGTTSTQAKLVVTLPPTIAHYNGTLQRHPAMAPRPMHPAMAPSNGTTSTQP